jgi:protein-tyrosine-phosphatase
VTRELLDRADRIITMTRGHRDTILAELPEVESKVRLLADDGRDICDPIGGGPEEYRECFQQISRHVEVLVKKILSGEEKVD